MIIKTILATAISTLAYPTVMAYETEHPDTFYKDLPAIEVKAKANVKLTPLDVTTISSEQINRSTESSLLPVMVQDIPGLFASERGFAGYGVSGGAAGTVNIRGVGGGNKVLFMIDGMPQWAGVFGHSLPDTYVANGVERIEVVKGPSSILYGSSAMGGSVNIITKRQSNDGVSGRARAMFGSFSTQKFNVATGLKKGAFQANVAGQVDRSNGNRKGSEFWLANEYANISYGFSDHWKAGGMIDMTQTKANNPGTIQSPLLSMWTNIFRGTGAFYVNNSYDKVNGGAQAWINWGDHDVDDGYAPGGTPRDYLFHSHDYNMGFTIFETLNLWTASDMSLGLDFQHWGGNSWNTDKETDTRTDGVKKCENEVAGYVMLQQGFFNDILNINAGVRLQHGSSYGNVWVPSAGVVLRPGYNSEFKFNFAKGFRSPNIRELYMYPPHNPNLKPEYMLNYEVSYSQYLLEGKLNLGAALYFIDGKDMIQTQMVDGKPLNLNIGKFKNKGFELETSYHFLTNWMVSANYSYLHTDNKVVYAPKNKLNARLMFTPGKFQFEIENQNIWSLQNGRSDGTENYTLLNFRGAYTFGEKVPVTAFVKLDNITDRHYEIIYGCPMPGITVMGGIEFKF